MVGAVEFRWSGQVMEPIDGLAFIGRNPGDDEQRLHRHRRLGHGHDARHDRRHAAHGPHPRARDRRGRRSTTRRARCCARRSSMRRRTSTSPRSTSTTERRRRATPPTRSRPGKAPCCGAASRRSPSIATTTARCTSARRCARTWAASCAWTTSRRPGTARATARASTATAASSSAPRIATSPRARTQSAARRRQCELSYHEPCPASWFSSTSPSSRSARSTR